LSIADWHSQNEELYLIGSGAGFGHYVKLKVTKVSHALTLYGTFSIGECQLCPERQIIPPRMIKMSNVSHQQRFQ